VAIGGSLDKLVLLLWPARWPATPIAVTAWWVALGPSAVILARLGVGGQGAARDGGRVAPRRADVIRSAAWEAQLQDLSSSAGGEGLFRPPRGNRFLRTAGGPRG